MALDSYFLILDTISMLLIVGLGNPGNSFKNTRHNVGREIISSFGKHIGCGEFRPEKKWNALISEGKIGKTKAVLILPETMMNNSAKAVAPATRFFKIKPKDIFVVHDDTDIALGRAKLSFGRNSAGHKGVESLIRGLKTRDFWRLRVGIAGKRDIPAEKLVLKKFMPDEQRLVKKITKRTITALDTIAEGGPERAMNEYNKN